MGEIELVKSGLLQNGYAILSILKSMLITCMIDERMYDKKVEITELAIQIVKTDKIVQGDDFYSKTEIIREKVKKIHDEHMKRKLKNITYKVWR